MVNTLHGLALHVSTRSGWRRSIRRRLRRFRSSRSGDTTSPGRWKRSPERSKIFKYFKIKSSLKKRSLKYFNRSRSKGGREHRGHVTHPPETACCRYATHLADHGHHAFAHQQYGGKPTASWPEVVPDAGAMPLASANAQAHREILSHEEHRDQ